MQFIDLQAQYKELKHNIDKRIQTVLDHGKYIMGPEVSELEERLCDYIGVKHAITCANGTDALQLALMAIGAGRGDAVFCPTFTFFATAEAPAFLGIKPIFVDSKLETFNICPISLESAIVRTLDEGKLNLKAIIAVDLFGLPANYPEIENIAQKYQLTVIADSAQGFGGTVNGKRAGCFGDIATTSFFPAKPLGCYGDGGAVFTNDDEYAALIRSYRLHGKGYDKYDNMRIGVNSRLDTIQAAILLEKLAIFPTELKCRNESASYYTSLLDDQYTTPFVPDDYSSSWAQYTLQSPNRDNVLVLLKDKKIPSNVYYQKCMHQQTAFRGIDDLGIDLTNAEKLSKVAFSLPMHPYLSAESIEKTTDFLNGISAVSVVD